MDRKLFIYLNTHDRNRQLNTLDSDWHFFSTHRSRHTIEGVFFMTDEQVLRFEELDAYCETCLSMLAYSDKHDAMYCIECAEWCEEICSDVTCRYCAARPKKPFS